ncbi:hypothetical protein PIECOFPK_01322 [Mycovorax composti]|jgi:Exopolysaccharide biosynthesis protein related to N-acetylglucosamine-1-phosphodiester alpha-N-acetylglucosaminidase|uniref:Phosphodiester glycosidase domain-containing protein n=2 Tax=Chitinophagaceae TaxID=563835 RepID=A0ABZ2EJK8_9BACT
MVRYLLSIVLFLFFTSFGNAQYYDSVCVVNAPWKVEKLGPKVKLYHYHFTNGKLFKANQHISFIVAKNKRAWYEFAMAAEPRQLRTVSDFAGQYEAIGAINGNFFDMKNGGAVDFTKVNGDVINTNKPGKNGKPEFHQKAAVVIDDKGSIGIKKWDGLVNWDEWLKEPHVMFTGPLLLLDRQIEKLDSNSFNVTRHPRTAVGIAKRGKVIMLVVDGRHTNSAGMSLFELTKVMRWLGCVSAINLDGGGSSTLWVKGKGVVNYPSDNKKWDHEGERKVANILYLKKRK